MVVSAEDRARFESQARSLAEAENDDVEAGDYALRTVAATNKRRVERGLPAFEVEENSALIIFRRAKRLGLVRRSG